MYTLRSKPEVRRVPEGKFIAAHLFFFYLRQIKPMQCPLLSNMKLIIIIEIGRLSLTPGYLPQFSYNAKDEGDTAMWTANPKKGLYLEMEEPVTSAISICHNYSPLLVPCSSPTTAPLPSSFLPVQSTTEPLLFRFFKIFLRPSLSWQFNSL